MPTWSDLWALYCSDLPHNELDNCPWLLQAPTEWVEGCSPVDVCDRLAQLYSAQVNEQHRKKWGQFFTPPAIARFMIGLNDPLKSDACIVEPGAGTGVLLAALAEKVAQQRVSGRLHFTAYEIDSAIRPALTLALGYIRYWLKQWNIQLVFEVQADDFILTNISRLRPAPLLESISNETGPDLVISNPPYFKIPKTDPRVAILAEVVHGQPNIYALIMAASAKLLKPDGQMIFITPRSFCSGPYFRQFRKWFFRTMALEHIHLFESRTEAFGRDQVLQENTILKTRKSLAQREFVNISSSRGIADLETLHSEQVPLKAVLDLDSAEAVLSIPISTDDQVIQNIFKRWPDRLNALGLEISTGPVIPFRTTALVDDEDDKTTAPLVWVHHIQRMAVVWPLLRFNKPQRIRIGPDTSRLLLPNKNLVLIRRFSPKEDNCRITAAAYFGGDLPSEMLGVENHVNYVHRPGGSISKIEALGLAAFLNSRWVDHYFRLSSGNTQVSATELRNLPMPSLETIRQIGKRLQQSDSVSHVARLNQIVGEELELPRFESDKNGGHMPKIEEAKDLLNAAGLPPAQRNELAALILLALSNLTETDPWQSAQRRSIRIHDMILFVEQNYHKRYAENTRETFRRQVLHQFEQARLIDRNPDDPSLPTNSPRTHYALSEAFLPVVQRYGTSAGLRSFKKLLIEQRTLLDIYQQSHVRHQIPLKDASGREFRLSPGRHNQLQVAVIEQFAPRFAPGAQLLYMGDAANKTLIMNTEELHRLGFPADKHNKLPDVILYLPERNRLFLIEVVTSHGPVSPKRHHELETMLNNSSVKRIYVSVFPDFKEFFRHGNNIAWETEIWLAETPDHLIHYDGDKFLELHTA